MSRKRNTPIVENMDQEEFKNEREKEVAKDQNEDQIEVSNTEKGEADSVAGEVSEAAEEAETKRRAAVAKRIREEAEASAKKRAEEDRLWEEAMVRRIAENEKRIREKAEVSATKKAEEKKKGKKKEEIEKITGEEVRHVEKLGTATNQRAGREKIHNEEMEAKRLAEGERQRKLATKAQMKAAGTQVGKGSSLKKLILRGSLAILLFVAAIWAISKFNSPPEAQQPALPIIEEAELEDPNDLKKTSIESSNKATTSTKLGVGDIYDGGIIFTIDPANNTGKIAHLEDAGPMPWQDAVKIHEQWGEGWRLPSFDELYLMYQTIGRGAANIGEFTDELYWSATAYDEYQARLIRFKDGNTSYHYNKNVEHRKFKVRAIRELR
ncbi:MAG: hypothetical protein WBM43_14430 [Flavobacteriaceae bacterium]